MIDAYIQTLESASQRAETLFASCSPFQLNWKERHDKWSIAQCLDHLVTTNQSYEPVLAQILSGKYQATLWQKISPLSGYFGNWMIETTRPVVTRPLKAPPTFAPAQSDVSPSIVQDFLKHNQDLIAQIKGLSEADLTKIIASPALAFITYSLGDALTIITQHEHRHLNQAERLLAQF